MMSAHVAYHAVFEDRMLTMLLGLLEYGLPMGEAELGRINMCHAKYCALIEKETLLGTHF